MDISILKTKVFEDLNNYEVVERKGIGHPDSLADAIAETASRLYSQYCHKNLDGKYAHHWFDKVMLLGGQSDLSYGKGTLVQPYKVIFAGKAALLVGDHKIPLDKLLYEAASKVLREALYQFNPETDLVIENRISSYIGPGQKSNRYNPSHTSELIDINKKPRYSNDCNVCSAYAPLSRLERLVIDLERYLNSKSFKTEYPYTGMDIKIVGIRKENSFDITVNIPFIADLIESREDYLKKVSLIEEVVRKQCSDISADAQVTINPEKESGRSYLTAKGSVADTGDIGAVGRGNRINGLITPLRSMSIEASCGKNPLDHTGKLYGVLAQNIANDIATRTGNEVNIILSTFKERKIEDPKSVLVQISSENLDTNLKNKIYEIVENHFNNIYEISKSFVEDGVVMW